MNFGAGITISGNGNDLTLFLAKYSPDGIPLWVKRAAPVMPDDDFPFGNSAKIAVDATGNVYWAGNYLSNSLDFGNGIAITRSCTNECQEGFLVKLNPEGHILFPKALRAAIGEVFNLADIAADSAGRHYVTGMYSGSEIWLQGGANMGGLTTEGYFLGAYSPAGNAEWVAFQTDDSGQPFANALTVSPDGERIAVTGSYNDAALNFSNGATTSSNAGIKNFVVWYNPIGQPQGARTLSSDQAIGVFDIRLDNQYRVWAACNPASNLQWNQQGFSPAPATPNTGMIAILPPKDQGSVVFSVPHEITSMPVNTLTLGKDGAFFAGGLASTALSVPGVGILDNNGCMDATLISGTGQTAQIIINIGGSGCERIDNFASGSHMATDGDGNLLLCGKFENGGTFGSTSFSGNGLWVAKLNTSLVAVQTPEQSEIGISPQPAAKMVRLTFPENARGRCRILSLTGKTMAESGVQPQVYFRVSEWPAGMYVIEYQDERGRKVAAKLVVQH